jgi:transcriptional regulator PpsR
MDAPVTRETHRSFEDAIEAFAGLSAGAVGQLIEAGHNIVMRLTEDGIIRDIAYRSSDMALLGADTWVGKAFNETVATDSRGKVAEMLAEVRERSVTRRRQVNHRAASHNDVPVEYVLVRIEGAKGVLAYGSEMRRQIEMQQQLINAQVDLERRNKEVTERAARYRAQFKLNPNPVAVVSGTDLRIADANPAAAARLGVAERKMEGASFINAFEASSRAALAESLNNVRFSGETSVIDASLADGTDVRLSASPFRDAGSVSLVVQMDASGGRQDARGTTAAIGLHAMPEACLVTDEDGTIEEVNAHFIDLCGLASPALAVGRPVSDWLGASEVDVNVLLARLKKLGSVRRFSSVVNDAAGGSVPVVVSAAMHANGGSRRAVICIAETAKPESHFKLQPSGDIGASRDFAELIGRVPLKELIRDAADIIEKMCIESALRQTGNNRASAADLLGLSRQSLYLKLRRYNLEDFTG